MIEGGARHAAVCTQTGEAVDAGVCEVIKEVN